MVGTSLGILVNVLLVLGIRNSRRQASYKDTDAMFLTINLVMSVQVVPGTLADLPQGIQQEMETLASS